MVAGQWGGPFDGGAEVGQLGGDVGAEAVVELPVFAQNTDGVFAHFLAGEKFGPGVGEVQAELDSLGGDRDANVVVGEEQPAFAMRRGAAGIEERRSRPEPCAGEKTGESAGAYATCIACWRQGEEPTPFRRSRKLLPTTIPITVPMIAPAQKFENQWMVMDTPKPT